LVQADFDFGSCHATVAGVAHSAWYGWWH
jgi:hypothetical protein